MMVPWLKTRRGSVLDDDDVRIVGVGKGGRRCISHKNRTRPGRARGRLRRRPRSASAPCILGRVALTPQILSTLIFEHLGTEASGQVMTVVQGAVTLACKKGLASFPSGYSQHNLSYEHILQGGEREAVADHVQQVMWQLLAQGVLVWGLGATSNNTYPFYRLTEYGKTVVKAARPQPYDPDGFVKEFDRVVPGADPIVRDYLVEAVRAFNASCFKSAAVMIGAASEQALLLLHGAFEAAIKDPKKKARFEKDSAGITVSRKYAALKDRLDRMVAAKALPFELAETVGNELPSAFSFIRRCRNDAGHPEIPTQTDPDTVFLNLRVFTEYGRRVASLTGFFKTDAADW
jgi:hypothetical protein